ncbi:ubiquitin carboxyl-terminal hydrolase [Grosmannia clavigera kw1407]|uniref:Ubiquitin carboxyl-terminal hydrolase n=1 Tax=Grosmannia clavigera (strain kw1407 / UAMH 11150) TaxID=655863 RepID=F0XBK3_GROCL|nr:ubiquitin carboxyl-terminal hydrolase [Grosmannia clavigera kw1407]EFX05016.1 ubiquitin carboxyl-terminal hydrolase [Grosmannia clavigera kw1407]
MADMDVDNTVPVVIKHQGKSYNIDVDTSEPGSVFKYQVYSLTSVQPENQKILCKASQIKDDTDMSKLRLKAGQVIMVLGQPGEAPARFEAPKEKTRFVEDMSARELAQKGGLAVPVGLENLGNTCYLNSSLQVMRSIPELQDNLVNHFKPSEDRSVSNLTSTLRDVFLDMSTTGDTVRPEGLLSMLRKCNERFAERTRTGAYAQQDAEEAWTYLINNLKTTLPLEDETPAAAEGSAGSSTNENGSSASKSKGKSSVIDRYMTGQLESVTVCDEAEGNTEDNVKPESKAFRVLDCHINESVNHLRDGLLAGLVHKMEKSSDVLGRTAGFTSTDRISQLPKYLGVHVLRFSWKRTAQLSTKILRKVTFPLDLDITEFCTDELRLRLAPIRDKVREVAKDVEEIERSKKKRKRRISESKQSGEPASSSSSSAAGNSSGNTSSKTSGKKEEPVENFKTDAEIEAEKQAVVEKAKEELYQLVKPHLEQDRYANHSGLYQLRAVLTHQGARSDSGHYTAFVKKGTILNPVSGRMSEEDGNWLWFNDETVTEVAADRIESLAGGGPSHSAFMLLYASVPLLLPENRVTEKFSQS